ncbi:MAG: 50S ribosomal protein L39e [Candidatus ainarchaeum sp.]|nr:50S ribosomal protein L39e [Candidatus ainarchaeum sp.]
MVKKDLKKKMRLGKKTRQNRRVPTFVTIRSKRKVQANTKTRVWRTEKIKARDKE